MGHTKKDENNIKVKDSVQTKENLTNYKRWFNGTKRFSSIKVEPAKVIENPPDLGVHVEDIVDTSDLFGRQ